MWKNYVRMLTSLSAKSKQLGFPTYPLIVGVTVLKF